VNAFTRRLGPCAVIILGAVLVGCGREQAAEVAAPDDPAPPHSTDPRAAALGRLGLPERIPTNPRDPDSVVTTVEVEEEVPGRDLTNEDPRLESRLKETLPDLTVPGPVVEDPVGVTKVQDDPKVGGRPDDPKVELPFFGGRSGSTKEKQLREAGGTDASELAVARGLAWLAKQQKADGSWEFEGSSKNDRIAATGMALLPFLAAGETHKSSGKYKETVSKGLAFLIKNLDATGKFTGGMFGYSHPIATIALCEAYGMTKDRALLLRPAQLAIYHIQQGQGPGGSWGYSPGNAGDTSVTGWHVQALQAARLTKDVVVADKVLRNAEQFLDRVSKGDRKAMYGYNSADGAAPGTALTASGLLCRYYLSGWGPSHPAMTEGVEGLLKNGPKPGTKDRPNPLTNVYYFYYATQVVHIYGGLAWKDWNEGPEVGGQRTIGMRDWLVNLQLKDGPNLGTWDPDRAFIGASCGRLGTTCMCLLNLEVYYRHQPLQKRAGEK
jgi:hypothetical protein